MTPVKVGTTKLVDWMETMEEKWTAHAAVAFGRILRGNMQ